MRIDFSQHSWMQAYMHTPSPEMPNYTDFPAMLILPGGGFRFCSAREGEPIAAAFYAQGYSAFVLDYTTVSKKPDATIADPMRDVDMALQWIQANAEQYHLRKDQVALIGFSGGAHLAAAVSTHGPTRPNVLILGYPGILHSDLRALECPDIVKCVDACTPPTFIFTTRNDQVTPPVHAMAFADALNKANVEFEMHIFRQGPHGLSLGTSRTSGGHAEMENPRFANWFPLCVSWLEEVL